jgi:transcription antitermination protein NusB
MPARRKSRQRALQVLFLWDIRKVPIAEALSTFLDELVSVESEEETGKEDSVHPSPDPFMETLARGTADTAVELDELIAKRAEHWRLERMPIVDRNILRMALFEMKDLGTPPAVVIDEALELARRYSEAEAIPFINGVLDGLRKLIFPDSAAAPA